jgi:putative transcriptional regulator
MASGASGDPFDGLGGLEGLELRVHEGTLLAAGPDMLDPNFMHRVVLLCRHSEDGAYGLVVNYVSEFTTRDVLATHPLLGAEEAPAFPIYLGGPVGLDTLQVLHRVPERISGGVEVASGIHVGGELADVARYVLEDPEHAQEHLRLALGYSGWAGGQLEAELALSSWLPAPPDPELVFGGEGPDVWRKVVRSLGRSAEGLAEQPPDPQWN